MVLLYLHCMGLLFLYMTFNILIVAPQLLAIKLELTLNSSGNDIAVGSDPADCECDASLQILLQILHHDGYVRGFYSGTCGYL